MFAVEKSPENHGRSEQGGSSCTITFLALPCGAGSTDLREGLDSSVIMPFSWCVVAVTRPL